MKATNGGLGEIPSFRRRRYVLPSLGVAAARGGSAEGAAGTPSPAPFGPCPRSACFFVSF